MIYVEIFGRIQSGDVLKEYDYGERKPEGFVAFDEKGKLAVSLAAQDVKNKTTMRSKSTFEEEIKKLLG